MPILDPNTLEFTSRSADQTRRIGLRLGSMLTPGDVICLSGDLGAGKTTLTQGIAQGWGSLDPVTSPTFILVNTYHRPDSRCLYHLDAYRLENAIEAEDLDLEPMLEEGILVIEWAERIKGVLPDECLQISMRWLGEEHRFMTFSASGERYKRLLSDFKKRAFGG